MAKDDYDHIDRRGALECMIWAGTGVLWTMVGGVQNHRFVPAAMTGSEPTSK
jgi:3',5'-cyclic-AMP phosphodiesterase